jgi:hypothetical protein
VTRARSAVAPSFVLLVLAASGCGDEASSARSAPRAHVASESCRLKTPAAWQTFLETTTLDQNWVKTCSDLQNCEELVGPFRAEVTAEVLPLLAECATDLVENPQIERCTARFRRYLPTFIAQHVDDSYGFRQDNHAYLAAHTAPDVPAGMMEPPAALLRALPERSAIETAALENGWTHATNVSCLGGTRTFVALSDPEGRFDQWMLVGLDATLTHVDNPTILSFIGVQKRDANGSALERVRLHFRDYLASAAEGGGYAVELPENFGGKCYACHTSGLRQLIAGPDTGALNERIRAYGLPDWNGSIDPADHGPRLGESLGCTECHNNEDRGALTVSTSEGMLWQKVVGQLAMRSPHGGAKVPDERAMALLERETTGEPPLTPDESAELERARAEHLEVYETLDAERFPAWRDWVLEVPCE